MLKSIISTAELHLFLFLGTIFAEPVCCPLLSLFCLWSVDVYPLNRSFIVTQFLVESFSLQLILSNIPTLIYESPWWSIKDKVLTLDVLVFDLQGQLPLQPDYMVHLRGAQERGDVARGPVLHPAGHWGAAAGALRHPGGQRLPGLHLRRLPWQQRRTLG